MSRRVLPRSLDDLAGRRFARWIRESSQGQYDTFGPDSQREQQDRAAARWALADTGLAYEVAVSGKIAWRSPEMRQMLDDARAGAFDVLLVGYSDRWQRNLRRTLEVLEDELHPAGVAVLFADRRILSSDPDDWDELIAEATAAERYIRRLAGRISDGLEAKWRRHADQAGNAPLGFRRRTEPPRVIEIDPATIGVAVAVFRRYAEGSASTRDLARETGIGYEQVAKMIRNPLYNGWVRRHRGAGEERLPAAWRADPPVDDALWRRVEDLRAARRRGGGRPGPGADLLRGLVVCAACSAPIRSNGTMGNGRRQRIHPDPCPDWPGPASVRSVDLDERIAGQLASARLTRESEVRVRAVLGAGVPVPADTSKARIRRRLRDLALEHAEGRVADTEYLAAAARLRADLEAAGAARPARVTPDEAIAAIRDLGGLFADATDEERARIVHAVYARIPIAGPEIRPVELTPWAYEHGLDQVLPELVRLDWRPRQVPGNRQQSRTARVPIAGRRERWSAARSA